MNMAGETWSFGRFRLDGATQRLLLDGTELPLKPKAFDLLSLLIAHNGRVVSKEQILETLWSGRFVEESILTQNVYEVRRALAQGGGDRYVQNVPKRGYRFVADATRESRQEELSIAVLPFRTLGSAAECDHIGLGLAEVMISALTQLDRFTVRSVAAVVRQEARDRDPLAAARALRARYVIDGSMQLAGGRIRVIIQLVDADAATVIWSDRFDGALLEIFELQDVISARVAGAVGVEVAPQQKALRRQRGSENSEAYQLYMQGRYNWSKATPQSLWRALEFFQRATEIDHRFPLAWVGISDAYTSLDWYGVLSTRESNPHAIRAATRALELDETLAEAHASYARALQYAWEWRAAEEEYRIAIAIHPELATSRQWYATFLAFTMRFEEALAQIQRARSLDPADPSIAAQVGLVLLCARRFEEAADALDEALALDADNVEARFYAGMVEELRGNFNEAIAIYSTLPESNHDFRAVLAHAYGMAGKLPEARAIIAELTASGGEYVPPFWVALAQLGAGEHDAAARSLLAAYDDPDDSLLAVKAFALFDPIRDREEFREVLRRMKLA